MPVNKESMYPGMMDAPANTETQLCFVPPNGPFDGESKASMVTGMLDSKHDEDWIMIHLSEGKEYTISVNGDTTLTDTVITLYDSKGGHIMTVDDVDKDGNGIISGPELHPAIMEFRPQEGSDTSPYFISVSAYNSNPGIADGANEGTYTVTVDEKVVLAVGEGRDIKAAAGTDPHKLVGTDLDDKLTGADGADTLDGRGGNDELNGGKGNDLLIGGKGADKLTGGDGVDTASYSYSSEAVTINLLSGQADGGDATGDKLDDTIENVIGSMHDDTLTGNDEDNTLWGLAGMDVLDGEYGDDIIEGGYGGDTLIGGDGSDTASYAGSMMNVIVRLHSQQAMHGDAEGDEFGKLVKATYHNDDGDPVDEMVPDIENLTGSAHDDILAGDSRHNIIKGGDGNDRLYGGPGGGNDMLRGQGGNDHIFGGKGNDTLDGGDGNDHLWGNSGTDIYKGGAGNDTIYASKDDTNIDGGDGIDTLSYARLEDDPGSITLSGSTINIENIIGSQDDDMITGDGGNNVIEGGEGGDTMAGGGGDGRDTLSYVGSDAGVRVTLLDEAVSGNWIDASRGHASGDSATDDSFWHIIGSMYDDDLVGNGEANSLMGGDGDDELTGMGGDDTVEGGAGADIMDGGDESNVYDLNGTLTPDLGDWLSYASSDAGVTINLARQLATGGHATGDEIVTAEEDHDDNEETDEIDVSTFEHVRGSAHDDDLTGDHRTNRLDGGAGADDLDGGGGFDVASFGRAKMGVTVDLGASKGIGGEAEGDTYSNIEEFVGSAHADTFIAGRGYDYVVGGPGSDTISYEKSRAGVMVNLGTQDFPGPNDPDTIGAWRYLADNLDKFYVDTSNNGTRDDGEGGFTSLEDLLTALEGEDDDITADNITINDGTGGAAVVVTTGRIQAARGEGSGGFNTTVDAVSSLYGSGDDYGNGRTDLRNNYNKGDRLVDIENVIGSDFDDNITGNSMEDDDGTADMDEAKTSANKLEGGGGKDTITGGAGNDVIDGGDGDDPMLDGGDGHDDIMGGAGRDKLNGGAGDDTLNGGAGDDDLTGGAGDDTFVFTPDGSGTDTIVDFTREIGNNDRIDLKAFGFTDTAELVKLIEVRGNNIVIDLSGKGGGQILVNLDADEDLDLFDATGADATDGKINNLSVFKDNDGDDVFEAGTPGDNDIPDTGDVDGIFII